MRWLGERYVRLYTRDTAEWLGLSFMAQALFVLILRKLDRSGRLALGRLGNKAVAVVIGHGGDWSRLEPALDELLADGCLVVEGDYLVCPNFEEAQESKITGAERTAKWRAGKKRSVTPVTPPVTTGDASSTERDAASPPPPTVLGSVTRGDAVSRGDGVTPSLSSLSSQPSQPSQPEKEEARPHDLRLTATRNRMVQVFEEVRGERYAYHGARDTEALKRLLALSHPAEMEARWRRGLALGSRYPGVHTLAQLAGNWNALAPPARPTVGNLGAPLVDWWRRLSQAEVGQFFQERLAIDPELEGAPFSAVGITKPDEMQALIERWAKRREGVA